MVLAVHPDVFGKDFQDERPDDRPGKTAHSPDDRHGQNQEHLAQGGDVRSDEHEVMTVQPAGQAGHGAGQGEGQDPNPDGVDPDEEAATSSFSTARKVSPHSDRMSRWMKTSTPAAATRKTK